MREMLKVLARLELDEGPLFNGVADMCFRLISSSSERAMLRGGQGEYCDGEEKLPVDLVKKRSSPCVCSPLQMSNQGFAVSFT